MPHITRALKSFFSSPEERTDPVVHAHTSTSEATKQLLAAFHQRIPSGVVDNASKMYSKASLYLSNFTRDKSQGELFFIATVLAAVILFAIILPACEAYFPTRTTETKTASVAKSVPSASSSTTDSLQTIEESEDEDLAMPIEKDEVIELPQQGSVEEMQDILNKSVEVIEQASDPPSDKPLDFANSEEGRVYDADVSEDVIDADDKDHDVDAGVKGDVDDADDKHSDTTPVVADEELETPTSSPPVSPDSVKPVLTNDFVSAPNSALKKRLSLGKLGKRLTTNRVRFRLSDSSDVSVTSTSSMRRLSLRGFGKKRDSGEC